MLKALQQFNKKHALFNADTDKLLLAVSGGVDSMVMLHLLQQLNTRIAVAHCNFQLRGNESDDDEQMVNDYCQEHQLEFFSKKFDTHAYAKKQGISLEMAARELRYDWFAELCRDYNFSKIATGHHAGDALETMIYNLSKGTGMTGLQGIKPKRDNIIRPLLFTNRSKIEAYARQQKVPWRTDASNLENIYHRNRIRNEVIPVLEHINPNLENTIINTLERIRSSINLLQEEVDTFCESSVEKFEGGKRIIKNDLLHNRYASLYLYEILAPYQFNFQQIKQIEQAIRGIAGKTFYSKNYQLTIDREYVYLTKKKTGEPRTYTIADNTRQLEMEFGTLMLSRIARDQYSLSRQSNVAAINLDKLQFPLTVRPWRQGDKFNPLGMRGSKKVSDFLIDQKIPLNLKNKIYLLESKNQVAWIINYRLDERFKVTDETQSILEITFLPHDQPI
ncbi:MAG: tRNA lysidine(34) synthetase TilS [Cyclobacteriaceae bacterium]